MLAAVLPQAIAVNSLLFNPTRTVGPAIAAVLISHYGLPAAFAFSAVSFLATLGALVLSRAPGGNSLTRLTRNAATLVGIVVIGFGLSDGFALGLLVAGCLGFAAVLCGVGLQVLLQSSIRHDYRGRVLGLWTATTVAGPGVGGALLGALAQSLGLKAVTIAAGVACVVLLRWAMPSATPSVLAN